MPAASILVAGATGDLGGRIVSVLAARGAQVTALVRVDQDDADVSRLRAAGAEVTRADWADGEVIEAACAATDCVVSALSGVREVIVDRQSILIDAAVRAGVPRFISSDYSADYTKTKSGHNRNFDLRREFMGRADRAAIRTTSILCGAYLDMLGAEMPIIRTGLRRILYWGDRRQRLDFTTRQDTAAYTACAALDADSPRILRIAGDTVDVVGIAQSMTELSGHRYRTLWAGTLPMLSALAAVTKRAAGDPDATFPAWQGMQYMLDQFSGQARLEPLDNNRYPGLSWTSVRQHLHSDVVNRDRPHP